jgi:SAM-dependent methyltransferase
MAAEEGIARLLAAYPKTRPELPAPHRAHYVDHYRANRAGESGLQRIVRGLESWMHRQVAAGGCQGDVLEIGAGNLNHLRYHPRAAHYDVIEPFAELWRDSPERARVRCFYGDISEIPDGVRYHSILSVAVLEHLTSLPAVLARSGRMLGEDGVFRAAVPSEGGFLWGLSWRCTTGLAYRFRRGLNYGELMRHEHVNNAAEILALLNYYFARVRVTRFPLPFRHLSFYTAVEARAPRLDRCMAAA